MADELKELVVHRSSEPQVELGPEMVSFLTGDGERHQILMADVVASGNAAHMLSYAQLVVMQTLVQQQAITANALSELVQALRGINPGHPSDPAKVMEQAAGSLLSALKTAGIILPSFPQGVQSDGDHAQS